VIHSSFSLLRFLADVLPGGEDVAMIYWLVKAWFVTERSGEGS